MAELQKMAIKISRIAKYIDSKYPYTPLKKEKKTNNRFLWLIPKGTSNNI